MDSSSEVEGMLGEGIPLIRVHEACEANLEAEEGGEPEGF